MPQETGPEESSSVAEQVPPISLSPSQMRILLNALMRTPVGVVQQVGFLLILFVALVESSLSDSSAPAIAPTAPRAAATSARHGNVAAVTGEDKQWAAKVIAFAKAKRARVERLIGEGGGGKVRMRGAPNVNVDSLRRWAVQSNRKVPGLLRLLQATPEIGIADALLVQYHAEKISPREAGKALAAAGGVLAHITTTTEGVLRRPRQAATAIQVFWRTGRSVRTQWGHEQRFIEVDQSVLAAVRLQALARGVIARREAQAAKEASTSTRRASEAWGAAAAAETEKGRSAAVRRAVEAVITAATEVQGHDWGMPLEWRDEALRRSTSAVGIQSATETASTFGPRRNMWYCGQSAMGGEGLCGSMKTREVPASKMAVANLMAVAHHKSLHTRSLIDEGSYTVWNASTSGRESINHLSPPTPEIPPTSDNTASSNSSAHGDDRPSNLPGAEQFGYQSAPSTHGDRERLNAITSSAQLSSEGRSHDDMADPPDHDRPVRLPLDEPELHFAPVPVVFDLAPDAAPTAAPVDRDVPVGSSVPLLPTNEESVHDQAVPQEGPPSPRQSVADGISGRGSPRSSFGDEALLRENDIDDSGLIDGTLSAGTVDTGLAADDDSGQRSPRSSFGDEAVLRESDIDDSDLIDGTISAGTVDTGLTADDESGQGSPRFSSGDEAVLREGDIDDSDLIDGTLSATESFIEVGRPSTVYDTDDADARMLWSREQGSFRSNSLGLPSEVDSKGYAATGSDISDGSIDFNDPPGLELARITPQTSASSIESAPSPLVLEGLNPRSPSPVHVHGVESKAHPPPSTPPSLDGYRANTESSPGGYHSAPSLGDSPGASFSRQTPLDVAAGAFCSRNPAIEADHQLTSIPQSAAALYEGIASPTAGGGFVKVEATIEPAEENRPGGTTRKNVLNHQAAIARVDDLELHTPSPSGRRHLPDRTLPAGTRPPSLSLPPTTQSPAGIWGRCEGTYGRAVERPGGRSWWVSFSSAPTTHAVRKSIPGEEKAYAHPEPATSDDAGLRPSKTDEIIRYSTVVRERSCRERARIAAERDRYRSIDITDVLKGGTWPTSISTGLLDEAYSRRDVVVDPKRATAASNNPDDLDVVKIAPSAPSSEDPMNPSLLGTERPEFECGVTPSFHLVVDKMMADWERATGGVVRQLPIIEESAITLDQAMVWPSPDSAAHAGGATGAGDEDQVYGGGQIIGLNGDVILSAGSLALSLEAPRTPSPSRRRWSHLTPPPGTPPSPTRSSPSTHSSPRRRRRREGSSTGSGAGRPRNLSRSISPCNARYAIATPPSSPDRLRAGTVGTGLAEDDGSRQGSTRSSSVGEAVLRGNDIDDGGGFTDGNLLAAGSLVEVERESTLDDSDDAAARILCSMREASIRANSLGLPSDSDSNMDGAGSISDRDSELASSQAPASSFISLPSVPLSDVKLSGVTLSDAVDLGDEVDTAVPALPTPLLHGTSTSAAASESAPPPPPQAERKNSAEMTTFECLLGEAKSSDAVPLPGPRSVGNGGRHAEGVTSDVAARNAPVKDTRPKLKYVSLIGYEEFKWTGLPNNNTG